MRADKAAQWALIRERGRRRYILVTGLLGWALPVACLSTLINHVIGAPGPFVPRLAIAVVVAPVFGYLFGVLMWSQNERDYRKWKAKSLR